MNIIRKRRNESFASYTSSLQWYIKENVNGVLKRNVIFGMVNVVAFVRLKFQFPKLLSRTKILWLSWNDCTIQKNEYSLKLVQFSTVVGIIKKNLRCMKHGKFSACDFLRRLLQHLRTNFLLLPKDQRGKCHEHPSKIDSIGRGFSIFSSTQNNLSFKLMLQIPPQLNHRSWLYKHVNIPI